MIIFDASTLILLAKAGLLEEFLRDFRQEVVIPIEVRRESCGVKNSLDALLIQKAIDEARIRVSVVKDRKLYKKIRSDFPLGKGEAEAIALAILEKADIVATDDRHGINACKLLRIPFTTAIAILIRMHEKKLIGAEDALIKLEALERYGRYRPEIIKDARSRLEAK
jgi:predicted nucleic acid-binding protein